MQAIYILPEKISNSGDEKDKFRVWSIILDFIILILSLYNIIHECCLAYYGKLY